MNFRSEEDGKAEMRLINTKGQVIVNGKLLVVKDTKSYS